MIDGWPEVFEQELMTYLLAHACITPAQFADHFHFSDTSAAYWLGCLVKSGKIRIARITREADNAPAVASNSKGPMADREPRILPVAMLEIFSEVDST